MTKPKYYGIGKGWHIDNVFIAKPAHEMTEQELCLLWLRGEGNLPMGYNRRTYQEWKNDMIAASQSKDIA